MKPGPGRDDVRSLWRSSWSNGSITWAARLRSPTAAAGRGTAATTGGVDKLPRRNSRARRRLRCWATAGLAVRRRPPTGGSLVAGLVVGAGPGTARRPVATARDAGPTARGAAMATAATPARAPTATPAAARPTVGRLARATTAGRHAKATTGGRRARVTLASGATKMPRTGARVGGPAARRPIVAAPRGASRPPPRPRPPGK